MLKQRNREREKKNTLYTDTDLLGEPESLLPVFLSLPPGKHAAAEVAGANKFILFQQWFALEWSVWEQSFLKIYRKNLEDRNTQAGDVHETVLDFEMEGLTEHRTGFWLDGVRFFHFYNLEWMEVNVIFLWRISFWFVKAELH